MLVTVDERQSARPRNSERSQHRGSDSYTRLTFHVSAKMMNVREQIVAQKTVTRISPIHQTVHSNLRSPGDVGTSPTQRT